MSTLRPIKTYAPFLLAGVTSLWLAILAIFTQIQFSFALGTDKETGWFDVFVQLSPWFLNWIWLSVAVFSSIRIIDKHFSSLYVRIIVHALLMVVLLLVYWSVGSFMALFTLDRELSEYFFFFQDLIWNTAQIDVLIYIAVLSSNFGIYFFLGLTEEKLDLKRLQHELLNEQLKSLYSQLNPHFLFNALNTVASLVRLKRESEAVRALAELSKMLRKILENKDNSDVRVKDEISFINSYLSIQHMRFEAKLDVNVNVDEDCLNLYIPNMLLHPLVENAVQHGSQLESNGNLLDLRISRKDAHLHIKLVNSVAKYDEHQGFGIGLSNTKERISKMHGDYELKFGPNSDGQFETFLSIPIGD
ncbi:MAG: sensor histidine kinase YesM [Paraglaciecola sp.]|jgi:sensor histidine kinase YesM